MDNNICQNDGNRFNEWGVCEVCGNTKAKQDEARKKAEKQNQNKFCTACGAQFNDNGVCPRCGARQGSVVVARAASDTMKSTWDYIKASFSSNPMTAVANAGSEKTHVWASFGFVTWIVSTLSLYCLGGRPVPGKKSTVAQAVVKMFVGSAASDKKNTKVKSLLSIAGNGTKTFFYTLGIMLLLIGLVFMLRKAVFALGKKKVSLVGAMNLTAVSMLPTTAAMLLAIPVSFLSPVISAMVMVIGIAGGYIQTYFGMQRAASYNKSPFWAFLGLMAGDMAALSLVSLLFYGVFCH